MAYANISPCQICAGTIMREVETIARIDEKSQSVDASIALLEAKRTIINSQLDEMIKVIKRKAGVQEPPKE